MLGGEIIGKSVVSKVKDMGKKPIFLGQASDDENKKTSHTPLMICGIDFKDTWNIAIAAGALVALILLIIMIVAATAIYAPKHQHHDLVFNKEDSLRYLYYSFAAYNSPSVGARWDCAYCIDGTVGFDVTTVCLFNETFAYVGYNKAHQEVVASFRGTSHEADWILDVLQNIQSAPQQAFPGVPGANVHQPFFQQYQAIQFCVVRAIQELLQSPYPVSLVGHGLGGALASFAAMDLIKNQGVSNVKVWTYGAPRVGNKNWADAYGSALGLNSQRMVDYDDCVPHEPSKQLGYWREPYEIWDSTGNGDYQVCDSTGEDPRCSNSIATSCLFNLVYMGVKCCTRP